MSYYLDGKYRCDNCGEDVGNGSVRFAAVVNDTDPAQPRAPRQLHFCRTSDVADGGCAAALLPDTFLTYLKENHDA